MLAKRQHPKKRAKLLKMAVAALMFTSLAFTASAQVGEFYYGSPDFDEVARDVQRTSNNNAVIVGYSSTGTSIIERDFFITLIDPLGNVLWTRKGGTQEGDVLNAVIELTNGNFVAVGYSNENTNGNQANSNKRGFIICYDASGNLQWVHKYRFSPAGSAGDHFHDVCQLSNGNLAIAGAYDERGNFSDGLFGYMDVNGNIIGSFQRHILSAAGTSYSDGYEGVVANGDEVFLSGICGDGSQRDGTITRLDAAGNVVFSNRYTYNASLNSNHFEWFNRIFVRDNQVIVNVENYSDYAGVASSTHGILRTDLNGNSPAVVDITNYNLPTNQYVNFTDVYPITATEYFSLENPASTRYATHSGMPGSDATISRVDATIPALGPARSIPRTGEQTLLSIDADGSIVTMVGSGNNDPSNIGGYDVYMLISDYGLITTNDCELQDIEMGAAAPAVVVPSLIESISLIEANDDQNIEVDETPFEKVLLCGEVPPPPSGGCDDKCYWKLTGNNSVSPTNFLGSINNEDLRLSTTNTTRVTIEKDHGNVGIGTHPGMDARLVIDHDGTATTFPNYLYLTYQGGQDYYRIGRSGPGTSFTPLVWAHKESVNNEPSMLTVGSTEFVNDNTSDRGILEFKSFTWDGATNAQAPTKRLLFNFGNLSQNYMKMAYNGYMGIGLQTNATYPTARLHVDCINVDQTINNPSNIRFENLQLQNAPYMLVIDDDGYVYRTDNPHYVPSDGGMLKQEGTQTATTDEVKKLQKEIDDLKNLVYELSKQKTEQGTRPADGSTGSNASLSPYLIDNVPNPYSQSTLIRYYLPVGTTNASITITNAEGITLETIALTGEGMGTVLYNANGLAAGTYAYTLYVGGQKIDTKKMLVTNQ